MHIESHTECEKLCRSVSGRVNKLRQKREKKMATLGFSAFVMAPCLKVEAVLLPVNYFECRLNGVLKVKIFYRDKTTAIKIILKTNLKK